MTFNNVSCIRNNSPFSIETDKQPIGGSAHFLFPISSTPVSLCKLGTVFCIMRQILMWELSLVSHFSIRHLALTNKEEQKRIKNEDYDIPRGVVSCVCYFVKRARAFRTSTVQSWKWVRRLFFYSGDLRGKWNDIWLKYVCLDKRRERRWAGLILEPTKNSSAQI